MILILVDEVLTSLHIVVTGFNVFGWIPKATRGLHRWCVLITAFCWIGVGLLVGTIGYCPLTDWQWRVKRALGERDLPHSFIAYLLEKISIPHDPFLVDVGVGSIFSCVALITAYLWWKERAAHHAI